MGSGSQPGAQVAALALRRAQKRLEAYCRRRGSRAQHGGWSVRLREEALEVYSSIDGGAVFRLTQREARWLIFLPSVDGHWHAYPSRRLASLEDLIEELEQAPLHIHW